MYQLLECIDVNHHIVLGQWDKPEDVNFDALRYKAPEQIFGTFVMDTKAHRAYPLKEWMKLYPENEGDKHED